MNSIVRNLCWYLVAILAPIFTAQLVYAQNCSGSHSFACGGACYVDAAQASSAGCSGGSDNGGGSGSNPPPNPPPTAGNGGSGNSADVCPFRGQIVSGCRTAETQDWCDTNCVTLVGNGNDGCINAEGIFVSRACVCSDPDNAIESMIDIEINLGIDIDDDFIANAGYVGAPPPINPRLSYQDGLTYFQALLGEQGGRQFADALNTNGDAWLTRNEASAAKGADPSQTLATGFGCGLSTDDVLAYVGLYLGDGSIDKYQGNLDSSVVDNMLSFTRTWQPGTDVLACQYRGGCSDGQTPRPVPTALPTTAPTQRPAPGNGDVAKIEAESGSILGSASVYNDGAASGGSGIAFISTQDAGFRITDVPASGSIDITYASEVSGQISVRVNGSDVGNVNFSSTGAWVGSYASASLTTNIPAGATVDIFYDNGDSAMNVDYVAFNTLTSSTPEPTTAPTAVPTLVPTAVPSAVPTSAPTSLPTPIATVPPVSSSQWYYIVHKPTRAKIQSCATEIQTPITSRPNTNRGECVQWTQVQNGEYFHIQNRISGNYMKPDTADDGSAIVVVPNTWVGNWTQWSFEPRGDGFGHIVNRGTGKFVQLGGRPNSDIAQQPSSWRGDFTRWRFEAAQ